MYCKASATLAITSASRITLMGSLYVKTNWAANLPTCERGGVTNPLQSGEIGDSNAEWGRTLVLRGLGSTLCCALVLSFLGLRPVVPPAAPPAPSVAPTAPASP